MNGTAASNLRPRTCPQPRGRPRAGERPARPRSGARRWPLPPPPRRDAPLPLRRRPGGRGVRLPRRHRRPLPPSGEGAGPGPRLYRPCAIVPVCEVTERRRCFCSLFCTEARAMGAQGQDAGRQASCRDFSRFPRCRNAGSHCGLWRRPGGGGLNLSGRARARQSHGAGRRWGSRCGFRSPFANSGCSNEALPRRSGSGD